MTINIYYHYHTYYFHCQTIYDLEDYSKFDKVDIFYENKGSMKWSDELEYWNNQDENSKKKLNGFYTIVRKNKEVVVPNTDKAPFYFTASDETNSYKFCLENISNFDPSKVVVELYEIPNLLGGNGECEKILCFSGIIYDGMKIEGKDCCSYEYKDWCDIVKIFKGDKCKICW